MSVGVNCWFCNEDSLVPAQSRDSWECPKCDQLNSFTADGDVVPPPPAAAHRNVRYNVAVQTPTAPRWQLCDRCNLNQQLKTRQLAAFRPVVEQRWQEELDEYRQHLERVYEPCVHCRAVVASALRDTDDWLRPAWLSWLRRRQQAPGDAAAGEPAATRASSKLDRLTGMAHRGAVRCGRVVRAGVMVSCSWLCRGIGLAQAVGVLLLLLLLWNSCLLGPSRTLLPAEYLQTFVGVEELFVELKSSLVLFCFILWILISNLDLSAPTVMALVLWASVCAVEMSAGHIAFSTAALLQSAPVLALSVLSLRKILGRGQTAGQKGKAAGASAVRGTVPSSTPNKTPPHLSNGQHAPALSNGHLSPTFGSPAAPAANGLPSPISPAPLSVDTSSSQPDYDYDLPRLSLGAPRRPAGSSGVFALRTYQPPSGGALFSGGGGRPAPAPLLSPARLRGQLHHSAWIAGGYWQRGLPAAPLMSRSSSQSSGPSAGDEEPRSWAGSQWDARSCVSAHSCGRPDSESTVPAGWACDASQLDSSSRLSARSVTSHRTADSSLLGAPASNRSVLVALVLGFSVAFNMFALLLLLYRDRL